MIQLIKRPSLGVQMWKDLSQKARQLNRTAYKPIHGNYSGLNGDKPKENDGNEPEDELSQEISRDIQEAMDKDLEQLEQERQREQEENGSSSNEEAEGMDPEKDWRSEDW